MENKTTSKLLTWVFVTFFLISIIIIGAVYAIFNINMSFLLNYLSTIVSIIILSYFGKSSLENYAKIQGSINLDVTNNVPTNNESDQSQG